MRTAVLKTRGRPTLYTPELADVICSRLADGESLRAICRDDGLPDERTVRGWARDADHVFFPQYARAREIAYHAMADDLLEIADDSTGDLDADGKVNADHIARSRLRVDTRKWMLSKMLPKVYGDKIVHQGDTENPVQTHNVIEYRIIKSAIEDLSGTTRGIDGLAGRDTTSKPGQTA
jgi:hypothetical protein